MKSVKVIFIAMEVAMLAGVILFTFLTDWVAVEEKGAAWMFKLMIVLLSANAVVFQCEQQKIEWNEDYDNE